MRELEKPLLPKEKRRLRRRVPLARGIVSFALLVALICGLWVALVDDPLGGRALARVAIVDTPVAELGDRKTVAPRPPSAFAPIAPEPPPSSVQNPKIIALGPRPPETSWPPERARPELLEASVHGEVPRIGPKGLRPLDAYARPASHGARSGKARVVIIVGGLGMSQTGTQRAIGTLPAEVTLGFAASGFSLRRWAEAARREGHEIVLQVPLEPHGYPTNDPGENTLLTDDPLGNEDRLAWALSRIEAYAGVMGFMGGRFTATTQALDPLLKELRDRGLYYVDDGNSETSLAPARAALLGVPSITSTVELDAVRREEMILRRLSALEKMARRDGLAVGVASAFPQTINAIASWAEKAGERDVVVVPASAALQR